MFLFTQHIKTVQITPCGYNSHKTTFVSAHIMNSILQQVKGNLITGYNNFIGVRAGGARGAAAPPKFGQLRFFWAARENLGKANF